MFSFGNASWFICAKSLLSSSGLNCSSIQFSSKGVSIRRLCRITAALTYQRMLWRLACNFMSIQMFLRNGNQPFKSPIQCSNMTCGFANRLLNAWQFIAVFVLLPAIPLNASTTCLLAMNAKSVRMYSPAEKSPGNSKTDCNSSKLHYCEQIWAILQ